MNKRIKLSIVISLVILLCGISFDVGCIGTGYAFGSIACLLIICAPFLTEDENEY